MIWTGVGCIHSFANIGAEPVRWIETQAPLPPAKEVFRFERDWTRNSRKVTGEETMSTEAQQPKPTFGATRTKPFTSAEFLESLRDGREIWIYGERVKDVTTHPAFRNTVPHAGAPV